MLVHLYILVTCFELYSAPIPVVEDLSGGFAGSFSDRGLDEPELSDLFSLIKREGTLIHNVFKLLRIEVAVFNSVEKRLRTRTRRMLRGSKSGRFDDVQVIIDASKSGISSQLKSIKQAKKIWSATKASTEECNMFSNVLKLKAYHPMIASEILHNGDILSSAKSGLESEKNGALSRKLKLGDIIDDSPNRLAELDDVRESLYRTADELTVAFNSIDKNVKHYCPSNKYDESESDA